MMSHINRTTQRIMCAPAAVLLFVLLLCPWPDTPIIDRLYNAEYNLLGQASVLPLPRHTGSHSRRSKLASAQGLSVPEESLGAGELATLDQFSHFQDILELSDDFTGGWGTGSKRNRRKRATYEDSQSLRQQQLELYHVAGAPLIYHSFNTTQTPDGKNYLPRLYDQGTCSTCVAHAVAAAAAASVASIMHVDAAEWDISPQSLYYCSYGGKTCASGWQIADALNVLENNPGIVRPSDCIPNTLVEAEIGSWVGVCTAAASTCSTRNLTKPWLSCSYKALSTFWQIQQSIRQYGAVVTRITVYDDFKPFFNPSKSGQENGIYMPSAGAEKLYGHAAVIVGYDNINKAWTLLNSWGSRSTSDGLFRIAMGQAGVGAPDETYAVICEPQPGTDLDPHEVKPWRRSHRKPVRLVNPIEDRTNLAAPCYYYDAVAGDTAASIADAFLLDVRRFAHDNTKVFKPVAVTAEFEEAMTKEQLAAVLSSITALQQYPGAAEAYFNCTDSSADTSFSRLCRNSDALQPCVGIANCTLHYQEPDVSVSPVGHELLVCGISSAPGQFDAIAYFRDPAVSQPRALRHLLDELNYQDVPVPQAYCDPEAWSGLDHPKASYFNKRWVLACAGGYVTELDARVGTASSPERDPYLNKHLAELLLDFKKLEYLSLSTAPGSILPPQLGALQRIKKFHASSWCWGGTLPPHYGIGWLEVQEIVINQHAELPTKIKGCGISGTLPVQWGTTMRKLETLRVLGNRLSGTLPPEYAAMQQMSDLQLAGNLLRGVLPSSYALWESINILDLSENDLEGEIPSAWWVLKGHLLELSLSNNHRLSGCIPLTALTTVHYEGTKLSGWCTASKEEIEQHQLHALRTLLHPLLNADGREWSAVDSMLRSLTGKMIDIWPGQDGQDLHEWAQEDSRGYMAITLRLKDGIVYVTELVVYGAGLDLALLPQLVSRLPQLESISFIDCDRNGENAAAMQLPASLSGRAPQSLTSVTMTNSGIRGTLPSEWGSWSSLTALDLGRNRFSGLLPASWKDMRSLTSISLAGNILRGTLPAEWGYGGISKASEIFLAYNPGLMGTIPASWSSFYGGIFVSGTSLTGCIPDQLMTNVYWNSPNVPCSAGSAEVNTLLAMRRFLDPSGLVLRSWDKDNSGAEDRPGSIPPGYCHRFRSVTCNELNQVTHLDLAHLKGKGLKVKSKLSLNRLLQLAAKLPALQGLKLAGNADIFQRSPLYPQSLTNFKALQHLDLSICGISGTLPPSLAAAVNLQHLNLSSNPLLSGTLPEIWAGLTDLQVSDISGCGVSGQLPESWAALQLLRVFRLGSNKPGVSGQLPESWGMLKKLEMLDVGGSRLTGTLPAVWADPEGMAAKAADMLATARHGAVRTAKVASGISSMPPEWLARAASGAAVAALQQSVDNQGVVKLGMLQLKRLVLSGNRLTGELPSTFAAMNPLEILLLDGNRFAGKLPVSWAALEKLQVMDLSTNQLTGPLPTYWGTLLNLKVLSLSNNLLSGTLPGPWGGLRSLRQLDLASCNLHGELPAAWFGLKELLGMNLSRNRLTGKFPLSWGFMADAGSYHLRRVDLSGNTCMDRAALQESIRMSKVEVGGRVVVDISGVGDQRAECH